MALLAVLSWRGLDGMARAQSQTSQRADEVLTLQAGLVQWKLDLDSLTQMPQLKSLDWDGRVLRLTRHSAQAGDDLQIVAWTRRAEAQGQWVRWQSAPLRTLAAWEEAWNRAGSWAQSPTTLDRQREVTIVPLQDWKLYFYRGGAWSNPLSSDGAPVTGAPTGQPPTQNVVPDGIRVVLTLAPNQAINGTLTLDWVLPTLSGARS